MEDDATPRWPRYWGLAFLVLLGLLAVWRWATAGVPEGGDWAQYLSHALALAEGRPYGDIGYLYSPYEWTVGPPRYPPGLALTLAPVFALTGPGTVLPLLLMHVCVGMLGLLAVRYFTKDLGPTVAWATGCMVVGSFLLHDRAVVVGSDLGFCVLVWGVLVLADGSELWSPRRTAAIVALGCAAILYRLAGAALVPAALLLALVKWRTLGLRPLLVASIWLLVALFVRDSFGLGERPSFAAGTGLAEGGVAGIASEVRWLLDRSSFKLAAYRYALSESFLYPFPVHIANNLYHVAALVPMTIGLAYWLRRRFKSFGFGFVLMTLLLLAAIRVWSSRYVWVLTPFVCYGLLAGVHHLVGAWGTRRGEVELRLVELQRRTVAAASLGLVLLACATSAAQARPSDPDTPGDWAAVSAFLAGLPDSVGVRVATDRPRKATWLTGHPAMPVSRMSFEQFVDEAQRHEITHVVSFAGEARARRKDWEVWGREYPGLLRPLMSSGPLSVYALDLAAGRRPSPPG